MDEHEKTQQQKLHDAIQETLDEHDEAMLTGWIVVYECVKPDGPAHAGHFYGPYEMTTWRALGLVEWAKARTLGPDDDDAGE